MLQPRPNLIFPGVFRLCLTALLTVVIAGCGSDSGGDETDPETNATVTTPPAPTLSLTPKAIKTFQFNWDDVAGETGYTLYEDPTGNAGYTEIANIAADATSHELVVSLPKRVNARYLLEACNSAGCSESAAVYVSGTLEESIGYVKASNTGADDNFGFAVALARDGNTLAIGSPDEDSATTGVGSFPNDDASNAGAVYIYTLNEGSWSQQAYIKASNSGTGDLFGGSVAISGDGNTLVVGASSEDSSTTGINSIPNKIGFDSGAVYVFTRSDSIWGQQAYIKASNSDRGDAFGSSVAISEDGHTLAVGALGEDSGTTGVNSEPDDAAPSAGAAYIFKRDESTWSQQAYIKASNSDDEDRFGSVVTLSNDGNTLAIGSSREASSTTGVNSAPNNVAAGAGAVYVFVRNDESWNQQAYVKASNTDSGDYFGISLALSGDGNTLAVGAYFESGSSTGVNNEPNNDAVGAGAVYVFTRSGILWGQQAYLKASNTETQDMFGYSVALSDNGNTLAAAALAEDGSALGVNGLSNNDAVNAAGAVYMFTRSGSIWNYQAYIKTSNTEAGDYIGASIALSGDGNTLAVGASNEDSGSTGLGSTPDETATDSGAVYLY